MRKPFTLVEVLIAMSVLSVFLLGLMQFYTSTETVLSSGIERTEMFERARIAMDMMANDLTCVYYSQTDDDLTPFLPKSEGKSNTFSVATVRPEKLNKKAKTGIVGVKYELKPDKTGGSDVKRLVYSYDTNGDTFDIEKSSFGNETELVEGVTDFSVRPYFGTGSTLPGLVVIRLELIDSKTLKRKRANSSMKIDDSNKREFRRMVVIDRGQPKPKL